ncbi:hypothetical protein OH77DRAFT_1440499 [Trametes cingulata]|nr:hypothetical protein OH77DRAFT_1440499 [Trametes cingulata]
MAKSGRETRGRLWTGLAGGRMEREIHGNGRDRVFPPPPGQSALRTTQGCLIEIASRLRMADQRALALSCWSLHNITTPILYRSLELCFHAPSGDNEQDFPNLYRLLHTLTRTTAYATTRHASRCYIGHVIKLRYSSYGLAVDRRALPMLASCGSLAICVFQRQCIIRKPFASVIAMHNHKKPARILGLPALKSLRCSRIVIAQAMMCYRQINSVVVERLSGVKAMDSLLGGLQAPFTSKTSHLSLNVHLLPEEFSLMIRATLYSFPQRKDQALSATGTVYYHWGTMRDLYEWPHVTMIETGTSKQQLLLLAPQQLENEPHFA